MEDVNEIIYHALVEMIQSVQQLSDLLINDMSLFQTKDLAAINLSNERKLLILDALGNNASQLQNSIPHSSRGESQTLSEYLNQIDYHHAHRIRGKINLLHEKLSNGYQQLINNNQVVTTNLGWINEIWEKLLKVSQQNMGVYAKPELK